MVMRSTLLSARVVLSAENTSYRMLSLGCAFSICSLLASLAITCSKYAERNIAAWPLPVAQSHARFLYCTSPTRNSNSDLGYVGLELAYSLDLPENRSLNFVGFKLDNNTCYEEL